jgi:hypothetical protein
MGSSLKAKSTRRSNHRRSDRSSPKSTLTPTAAEVIGPPAKRTTADASTPKLSTRRATRAGVPAALQRIQARLELIRSSVVVVAHALIEQNCELDDDAARVLGHHVTDALTEQMMQIGLLIHGGAS